MHYGLRLCCLLCCFPLRVCLGTLATNAAAWRPSGTVRPARDWVCRTALLRLHFLSSSSALSRMPLTPGNVTQVKRAADTTGDAKRGRAMSLAAGHETRAYIVVTGRKGASNAGNPQSRSGFAGVVLLASIGG